MLARIILSLVLCGLFGCVSNSRAPVEDRSGLAQSGIYMVKRGDTLYSIAFRSGMDYRKVAAANGISSPYTIYPGQKIYLTEAVPSRQTSASPPAPASGPVATPAPIPVRTQGSSTVYTPAPGTVEQGAGSAGAGAGVASAPSVPATVPTPVPVVPAPPPPAVRPAPVISKQPESGAFEGGVVDVWLWPTAGPVTRGYSESVHKGIDIGGARGDRIVAVAAGKVVYGGTGIVGYGEMLIIKHNEEYLSAYGHNDRLLVAEGETVTAGQIIAEKGSSGTDTVKLHFEIRREGKPIDPQRVLPGR